MQIQINSNNPILQMQGIHGLNFTNQAYSQQQMHHNQHLSMSPYFLNSQNQYNNLQYGQNTGNNLLKQVVFLSNQKEQQKVKQEESANRQGSWFVQQVDQKVQQQISNLYLEPEQNFHEENILQKQMKNFVNCKNTLQDNSSDYSNMKCSKQDSYTRSLNLSLSTNNTIKPVTKTIKKKKAMKSYQDTKNIPKNFGKAIMKYIKESRENAQKLLGVNNTFAQFFQRILQKKDKITSIKEFKTLFENQISIKEKEQFPHLSENSLLLFNKVYRILAHKFLQSEFEQYILGNKKIKHGCVMKKYKVVLMKNMMDPQQFNSWKISE